jgi:hypothetical protein
MPSAPYDLSISVARAGALFASPLQRSDEPSASQVRQAIATAIGVHGVRGCAAATTARCGRWRCCRTGGWSAAGTTVC